MTKNTIGVLILIGLGVMAGRISKPGVARAQSGCSVASLTGAYAYSVSGFFYDVNGFQGVYASNGVLHADGAGNVTGTDTVNVDGAPTRGRQFTGAYTVNPDCSGTMNLKDSTGAAITNMDMAITSAGPTTLVDYDPNLILSGTLKQQ